MSAMASKSVTRPNKRKDHPPGWSFLLPITETGFFTATFAAASRRRREWVSVEKETRCVSFSSVSRKQGARQDAPAAPKPHDYVFGRAMKNPTPRNQKRFHSRYTRPRVTNPLQACTIALKMLKTMRVCDIMLLYSFCFGVQLGCRGDKC